MKRRWVLLNPGPVNVTAPVRAALGGPDLCHREPEFSRLLADIRGRLVRVFGVERTHSAAVLSGSGTLAVEAMLASYARTRRGVLVLSNGVYGQRLVRILEAHRVPHRVLEAPLGAFVPDAAILRAARSRAIGAIAMVHHETSTGMLNPLARVAAIARRLGLHFMVDAVSSLGAETIDVSTVDLCAGSAGKCLHGHPGVAFVLVSDRLRPLLSRGRAASVYADLGPILDAEDASSPPFTPAVPLYYSFDRALVELEREGLGRRIRSYAARQAVVARGLERAGLSLVVPPGSRSHVLTAAWLPASLSYAELHAAAKKAGFVIYAGQSSLAGRIFRVSNLGGVTTGDLRRFLKIVAARVRSATRRSPRAVVLAAGVGRRLGRRTRAVPKCLVDLGGGCTLLDRYFDAFRRAGIRDVVLVVGHLQSRIRRWCRERARGLSVRFVVNPEYRLGSVLSLHAARRYLDRDVLVMDADVFFPAESLERLVREAGSGSAFLYDPRSSSTGEEMMLQARGGGRIRRVAKRPEPGHRLLGEATGIVKLSARDARALSRVLEFFRASGRTRVEYEDAYCELLKSARIGLVSVGDVYWKEMDFEGDLRDISQALTDCQALR